MVRREDSNLRPAVPEAAMLDRHDSPRAKISKNVTAGASSLQIAAKGPILARILPAGLGNLYGYRAE